MSRGSLGSTWTPMQFEPEVERAYVAQLQERTRPLFRIACLIGAVAFAGYQFWDLLLDPDAIAKSGPYRAAVVALMTSAAAVTYLPAIREHPRRMLGLMIFVYTVVACGLALIFAQIEGAAVAGVAGFIFGMIFVPLLVSNHREAAAALAPLVSLPLLVMWLVGATGFEIVNTAAWTIGGASFALGFAYLFEIVSRRAFHFERRFAAEKARSEALLLNILPPEVAERLKAEERPIADQVDMAGVVFADLAGFTRLSRTMPAAALVALLDDLFSRFDAVAAVHGAEKIKTIGDAYMAATGLGGRHADPVGAAADLALGMRAAFEAFRAAHGLEAGLRIGVHAGPVVSGVIGTHKFAYDLWGDTVNLASRMESGGLAGAIQVSDEVAARLKGRYRLGRRGIIEVKGHAPRETFLLEGAL